MIYITGDTHNSVDMSNLSAQNMKLCCKEQNVDYHDITHAIILGDFGLPWSSDCGIDEAGIHPNDATDKYLLKWYKQKPFKILAVMGNHDNYDMIEKLPEVEMFGSTVLKVSDNVFYLKRGGVYDIEGKKFLVLGGALCDDKAMRIPHESWWEQEEWTEEAKENCIRTVEEHGRQFDYVLSHTGPSAGKACINPYFCDQKNVQELYRDSNVVFNDRINSLITYKKWFFGHWHSDWGYENFNKSQYVPLFHQGIVL